MLSELLPSVALRTIKYAILAITYPALVLGLGSAANAQTIEQAISNQSDVIQRFSAPRVPGTIDIAVPELRLRIPADKAARLRFKLRS